MLRKRIEGSTQVSATASNPFTLGCPDIGVVAPLEEEPRPTVVFILCSLLRLSNRYEAVSPTTGSVSLVRTRTRRSPCANIRSEPALLRKL
jgi:hypothetical protein